MGMGLRLRAGRAVPLLVASFPACIPCSSACIPCSSGGCQATLLGCQGCPQYQCPHPLLHPCSGMRPALRLGEFTLQLPLPRAPARWHSSLPPCPTWAACADLSAAPQSPQGCSQPHSGARVWMRPAPAALGEGASQGTSNTPGSHGMCQALPLSHPVTPRARFLLPN